MPNYFASVDRWGGEHRRLCGIELAVPSGIEGGEIRFAVILGDVPADCQGVSYHLLIECFRMPPTLVDDIALLVPELTRDQQRYLLTKAREFTKQNISRSRQRKVGAKRSHDSPAPKLLQTSVASHMRGSRDVCRADAGIRVSDMDENRPSEVKATVGCRTADPHAHSMARQFKACPICKVDVNIYQMYEHQMFEHKAVVCPKCDVLVTNGTVLTEHLSTHVAHDQRPRSTARSKRHRTAEYDCDWDDNPRVVQGGLCSRK